MTFKHIFPGSLVAKRATMWKDEHAAQLVEFAVSLPLLVLFVVGIFDFSGAFTLKQKLTNVAREASRIAAADPANTRWQRELITLYREAGNVLYDQRMSSEALASYSKGVAIATRLTVSDQKNVTAGSVSPLGSLTWRYKVTPTSGSPCGITLTINRGYVFPVNSTTPPLPSCASQTVTSQTAIVGTCVSIEYAYAWKFGRVSTYFGPSTSLPAQIGGVAVAMNEN